MILSLVITSFGFHFVSRFHQQLSKFFLFSVSQKLFFSAFSSSFLFFLFISCYDRHFVLWIIVFLIWLTSEVFIAAVKSLMEKRLKETAVEFIDQCCLSISSGNSFRVSVQKVFLQRKDWCANQFKNLAQNLTSSDKIVGVSSGFLAEFAQELIQIDHSGQKINEQLKVLRRILKTEINFRRKSGQILRNLHIQSTVLTLLYFIFIFFVSSQVELFKFKSVLSLSISLFVFGLILTSIMGRRLKWKV